jgi:hypothetical protein
MNQQVSPRQRNPALLQHDGNAENVIAPRARALRGQMVDIEFQRPGKFLGMNHQLAIVAPADGHVSGETDRSRQDETFVVVGVLTD